MASPNITVQVKGGITKVVTADKLQVSGAPASNSFGVVAVVGQNNVVAHIASDTLEVKSGSGILVTTDSPNNAVTISATGGAAFDQFARDHANAAFDQANGAFDQANNATLTAQEAFDQANTVYDTVNTTILVTQSSYDHANGAFDKANGAIFTAAQIRANLSNTAPINYDSATGTISHADSSVTPTTYGNTTFVPTITVDAKGHVTSITNTAIALPPSFDQFARDTANGAFLEANAAYNQANTANVTAQAAFNKANAANVLANTANTTAQASFDKANSAGITAQAGFDKANSVNVTAQGAFDKANAANVLANTANTTAQAAFDTANGAYSEANTVLIIAQAAYDQANDAGGIAVTALIVGHAAFDKANTANVTGQSAFDKANGAAQLSFVTVNVAGQSDVVADSNSDTLVIVAGTGIVITTDSPNDTITFAATGGSAIDQFSRDHANGAFDKANGAAQNSFVTFNVAGQNDIVADSNTDTLQLIAGTGMVITTDSTNATITFAATGGSAVDQFARDQANAAFNQANTANTTGQSAFNKANAANVLANTANTTAQASFDKANNAGVVASSAYNQANLATSNADAAFARANVANVLANTANTTAQAAFDKANTDAVIVTSAYNQANIATSNADAAFAEANAAYANANTAIYTAAQIRANVSNTTPINYDPATGVISHADSGVVATTYGNTTFVPVITVDAQGHVTAITNTAIALPPSTDEFARATANAAYNQANVATTNADAAFTKANGSAQLSFVTVNVAGQSDIVADSNSDTLILVAGSGISISTDSPNDIITITATGGSAFDQFARDQANGAFDKANVATTNADAAFLEANAAFSKATIATTNADAAFAQANSAFNKASIATTNADAAFLEANAAYANANTAIYTAGQIRANLSNTAPINYDPTTGVISHALSGVAASGYGDAATVPKVVVDDKGHVTSVTNTTIAIDTSQITSGTLAVGHGGTGQTAASIVNGAVLIGNTVSGGYDLNTLVQGTGIVITNDKGSITIAATGGAAADQFARDQANAAFNQANVATTNADAAFLEANAAFTQASIATTNADAAFAQANSAFSKASIATTNADAAFTEANAAFNKASIATTNADAAFAQANAAYANANTAIYTAAQIRANLSNTAPINYDPATGIISHAVSGVTPGSYGDAATVAKVVVDSDGHVTSVVNTAIAIDTSQIASGTLSTGRGGTGQTAASIVNGALLIGNTVSGGYDLNTITQGTGILVTNDKGTITIAAAASGSGNAFGVVNVSTPGQSNIVASGATTLILVPGTGIMMTTDATSNAITITSAGSVPFPKSVDILFPTTGDEITFFYTNTAITFSRVVSVVKGSAPNVVFSLSYANTRAPGTVGTAITGQVVCSNTTNGVYTTAFTNATVPANNYVFLDIVSSVGNETEFHVTMEIATVSTSFVDQYARDKANGSVQTGFVTVNVAGQLDVVADSNTDILTLVAGSGINITTDAPNDTITLATTTTLATPVNTTSGTSIDFTGIPAGTKKIFVMFSNVSTNSTSSLILQIGDSGGIRNTGYASIGTTIINGAVPGVLAYTTGFGLMGTTSTTDAAHWNGTVMLTLLDASAFTWTASGTICRTDVATTGICTGAKSLPATLDRLRITTVLGTQAFDAGSINIIYE